MKPKRSEMMAGCPPRFAGGLWWAQKTLWRSFLSMPDGVFMERPRGDSMAGEDGGIRFHGPGSYVAPWVARAAKVATAEIP
jgi:hypothetical protein